MDAFKELKPALSSGEALTEADRCLRCHDAPCTRACPTHIDVPGFIKKIATGNLRGSARTILSANILGASCARVCPTEVLCEGACVLEDQHKPIAIGRLQRYATDWLLDRDEHLFEPAPRRDARRVAVVGAGPAGLACAAELARLGIGAVVFEAAARAGGLNAHGVAEYKMTLPFALREVEWVEQQGVEVRCGVRVGESVSWAELEAEFAAIFVGVGLGAIGRLGIPGEDLDGVIDALGFIEALKTDRETARGMVTGRHVVVIGGGNTAVDAAVQAVRLGAEEVSMVYRRGPERMTAYAHELDLARRSGCRFIHHAQPVRLHGTERVTGLELRRTRDDGDRLEPVIGIAGSEFTLECDLVIEAIGQTPRSALIESIPGVRLVHGRVEVDEHLRTANPRYFAGGDCVSGGQEVVHAVAEGKRAAQAIADHLTTHPSMDPVKEPT